MEVTFDLILFSHTQTLCTRKFSWHLCIASMSHYLSYTPRDIWISSQRYPSRMKNMTHIFYRHYIPYFLHALKAPPLQFEQKQKDS